MSNPSRKVCPGKSEFVASGTGLRGPGRKDWSHSPVKVHVDYTIDVDDNYRRAIRRYYGESGLATRDEVRNWLKTYGSSMDTDIMRDLDD